MEARKPEALPPKEPRLLTSAERGELATELSDVFRRLNELQGEYYAPRHVEGVAGKEFDRRSEEVQARHHEVVRQMRQLQERRDWINECLETGIFMAPAYTLPLTNYKPAWK